jgi:DNA modification methylase
VNWRIEVGDCRDVLRSMLAQSVHTVVTSPPYFGLRDYGTQGQIGLEPTPDEFVATLVDVFREVRRVLRDDGTVWLNLGDSYAGSWGAQSRGGPPSESSTLQGNGHVGGGPKIHGLSGVQIKAHPKGTRTGSIPPGAEYKPKDLLGIPWMVAFALRADGWYLRSDIIWSKPNPMPESVTDRPTKAHEYLFLLSKRASYFYDADAIREPSTDPAANGHFERYRHEYDAFDDNAAHRVTHGVDGGRGNQGIHARRQPAEAGRNKRSVWTVATQPYAGAHFATFPPKLIEPCILAGAPERACGECGTPWVKIIETDNPSKAHADENTLGWANTHSKTSNAQSSKSLHRQPGGVYSTATVVGFEPSCSHGDGTARGVVLDPFAGAGTTGMVALQHGREFVGIELSPVYAQMARERIETAVRLGFRAPQNGGAVHSEQVALFDLGATR